MMLFYLKKVFQINPDWDISEEVAHFGNVTKEVKFRKAKESAEVGPTAEKPKIEEKRNVGNERLLNSHNQFVGRSESRAKSRP